MSWSLVPGSRTTTSHSNKVAMIKKDNEDIKIKNGKDKNGNKKGIH
jgi:hypothetical protein